MYPEALTERLSKDIESGIRKSDIITRSLQRIPLYDLVNTAKVDVSHITPFEAAEIIAEL